MATYDTPQREHPSTYFVQDRSNQEELARLQIQDEAVTAGMGGVLPAQLDPARFKFVLDVACGTGNWLLTYASNYPSVSRLTGVDISGKMIEYANSQAAEHQVAERVQFHVMDALRGFEFPDGSFDLIHQRFGSSYLRNWDWANVLREMYRVCKASGVVCLADPNMIIESNSAALTRLFELQLQSAYQSGHMFTLSSQGLNGELATLLHKCGFQNVETTTHTLEYRGDAETGRAFYENMKRMFRNVLPFMRRWIRIPDNYETLHEEALHDIQQPDFVAHWCFVTAWGNKPGIKMLMTK